MAEENTVLEQVFEAQGAAGAARRRDFGLAARRAALGRLAQAVQGAESAICDALAADLGRAPAESLLVEVTPLLQDIAEARRHLPRWMRPRRVRGGLVGLGTVARLVPEPRGRALIIAPWNYPVSLALGPLVSALAAGCSAIIKPSELAPATSALIARLVADCFPPDLVAVVEGDKDVATRLLALPFDHIFFTGSPAVGRVVMAAAARHLTSVTLELGGKSPCIIGPGADLASAARWVAFGKFANAGQTCIAPDHLFVHDSVAAPFKAVLLAEIARIYPGGRDLAAIVSDRHATRLRDMLAEALNRGARLLTGGPGQGRQMPPSVLEALAPDTPLACEEIFGPILPILPFSDIETVISRINAGDKPLALYIFDHDRALIDRVVGGTSSGAVGVNLTMIHFSHPGLPFGGVGVSGQGQAHGRWGFLAFSHEKPVLENRFSPAPLLFPPYGARSRRMIGWVKRLTAWSLPRR